MKPHDPFVIERPKRVETVRKTTPSGIKTILFHVHDDDLLNDRLQVALTIARACGAHLHCLHVCPIEAYTVVDTFGGTFVNAKIVEALEEQSDKLRAEIKSRLEKEDVSWDYEEVTGELVPRLVQSAALSDLVITGREPKQREFGGPAIVLLGELLVQARTPLLVLGAEGSDFDPFGTVVVGWNGSYEAANAIRGALPLLRLASDVRIIRFSEEKDERFPPTALLEYLSRQGVSAELETREYPPQGLAAGLVHHALVHSASMIVIGGYSHSRAGEFLFGGVTRQLLKSCALPLLVAH